MRNILVATFPYFLFEASKLCLCFLSKASEEHLRQHYADLSNLPFFPGLVKHMASGPVVAMVRCNLL